MEQYFNLVDSEPPLAVPGISYTQSAVLLKPAEMMDYNSSLKSIKENLPSQNAQNVFESVTNSKVYSIFPKMSD